jgi:hypothetical protein
MQIFVLDYNTELCAKYHCDKHVVSAIKEHCQLLSTCHYKLGTHDSSVGMLAPTHHNHPCNIWLTESIENYAWLIELTRALLTEKLLRFKTPHEYTSLVNYLSLVVPPLPNRRMTDFALAMPDEYKIGDVVSSYRAYYVGEKSHFAKWKFGEPAWFTSLKNFEPVYA